MEVEANLARADLTTDERLAHQLDRDLRFSGEESEEAIEHLAELSPAALDVVAEWAASVVETNLLTAN